MSTTPVELLLSKLPDAKKNGKGWSAGCPAHYDQHPSLSVAEGDDGRALVRCHAGCAVEAICAAVGLRVADLMPKDPADIDTTRSRPKKTAIVSTSSSKKAQVFATANAAVTELERGHGKRSGLWTYHDAHGNPVGLIVRWDRPEGKDIRPVARNGDGWIIGGIPEPRPLYCLPDLTHAKRVYVTEGEKAADAARSIGLTATTSPHGSKSAKKANWSPLAGKEVLILPDNDQPGRAYAEVVVAILAKLKPAPMVKVVDLPGLPDHGDMADWVEAHDAVEPDELHRQVEVMADDAAAIDRADLIQPALAMLPWKPFPVEVLPEPVAGLVRAGAKALGCDPSYVALPLLAALASATGATRRIRLKPGWTEPSVVWAGIVGESGTLKSPAVSCALSPLRRIQAFALAEYPELLQQYNRDMALYEADMSAWKKSGRAKGEPPPEKPEEPQPRRYLVDDITVEALAERLQAAPRGLLCGCDELAAWLRSFDRYKAGGRGADVHRWLSIYRAESLLVDRKTGAMKTVFIPRAAVSICGGIQPETLRRALGDEHIANGLAARLLLAMPPRLSKTWTDAAVDPDLQRRVDRVFGRLLGLDFGIDDDEQPAPIDIPLSGDGKRAWVEFYDAHAQEQAELTGELASAWSKLEAYAARLALIVHLVRVVTDDPTVSSNEVDAQSITAGVTLAQWFKGEARRVYATLGETDEERDLRRLVEAIRRRGGSVTVRDLMRSSRQYRTADDAEAALDDVAKARIARWEVSGTTAQGGRPTRRLVLVDAADVDETPSKPEENRGCVGVNAVNGADGSDSVNGILAEAAAENSDDWGEV